MSKNEEAVSDFGLKTGFNCAPMKSAQREFYFLHLSDTATYPAISDSVLSSSESFEPPPLASTFANFFVPVTKKPVKAVWLTGDSISGSIWLFNRSKGVIQGNAK